MVEGHRLHLNLFRSEEHIERWLGNREPGATLPIEKLNENQAILHHIGLTEDFWRLPSGNGHRTAVRA